MSRHERSPLMKTVLSVAWIVAGGIVGEYIINSFAPTLASASALALVLLGTVVLPTALAWKTLQ